MSLRHRWQAWRELWGRYARAFAWHWQRRDQLQGRMLRWLCRKRRLRARRA